jgi:hypothetical protein
MPSGLVQPSAAQKKPLVPKYIGILNPQKNPDTSTSLSLFSGMQTFEMLGIQREAILGIEQQQKKHQQPSQRGSR